MTLLFFVIIILSCVLSYYYNRDSFLGDLPETIKVTLGIGLLPAIFVIMIFYYRVLYPFEWIILIVCTITSTLVLGVMDIRFYKSDSQIFNSFIKILQILIMIFGLFPIVLTATRDLHIILSILIYLILLTLYFYISIKFLNDKLVGEDLPDYHRKMTIRISITISIMIIFGFISYNNSVRETFHLSKYLSPVFYDDNHNTTGFNETVIFDSTFNDESVIDVFVSGDFVYVQTVEKIYKYSSEYELLSSVDSDYQEELIVILESDSTNIKEQYYESSYTRPYDNDSHVEFITYVSTNFDTQNVTVILNNQQAKYSNLEFAHNGLFVTSYSQIRDMSPVDKYAIYDFYTDASLIEFINSVKIIGSDIKNVYLADYNDGVLTITEYSPVSNYRFMYFTDLFSTYMILIQIVVLATPFDFLKQHLYEMDKHKKII